ncbi:hypothetical protein M8037_35395 [Sinorhizobium meliloti]|uniref:hypothetical protein n=1 Tax=Rhizobium meliloti TaxID=382 RepID=UPI0020746A45|nr:hypothetical protein [Sinorhizobium meliloti]MCM5693923.1 hypothetical protein [Sinorhizobium meliloti]
MFDIACVMKTHGVEYLDEALEAFQDKCEAALKVARQTNPQFAETIMTVCDVHAPSIFQLQRSEVDLRAVK